MRTPVDRWLPILGAIVGLVVGLLFGIGLLTGGGHKSAPYSPTPYQVVKVCPSAARYTDRAANALHRLEALGCRVPLIERDECEGPPKVREVQVRDCTDVLVGVPSCDVEHVDLVIHGKDAGLAYIADERGVSHAMGHVVGLGHTTAATSIMHPVPGDEWSWIDCKEGE